MNVSTTNVSTWRPGNLPSDPFFDPAGTNPACALDVNGVPTPILDAHHRRPDRQRDSAHPPHCFRAAAPHLQPADDRARLHRPPQRLTWAPATSTTPGSWAATITSTPSPDSGATGCGTPLFVLRFAQDEKVLADPAFADNVIYVTTYLPRAWATSVEWVVASSASLRRPHRSAGAGDQGSFQLNLPTSKLDLGANPQLARGGIPSGPMIRAGTACSWQWRPILPTRGRSTWWARRPPSRSRDGNG